MHFTDSDGYQNFLVFAPIFSSLISDSNNKITNWIPTGVSSEKNKPFDTNFGPTMSNLINGGVLFGTVKLTRKADKSKFTYNGRGIEFDGRGYWGSDNDTARNVVIFGVDNSSSSHIDNPKNNFLALGEEPTRGINGSVGTAE